MPAFPLPLVQSLRTLLDRTPALPDVDDIGRLRWSELRRIGRHGRLRVRGQEFRVAVTAAGKYKVSGLFRMPDGALGQPGRVSAEPGPTARRIKQALVKRAAELCLHVHPLNRREFDNACSGFAISQDLDAPAFRRFLDACLTPEGGRLKEGSDEYRVRVGKPRRAGQAPRIHVAPVARSARFLCLLNALLHVFRLSRNVMPARRLREQLEGALTNAYHARTQPPAGTKRVLDAVQAAASSGLRVHLAGADLAGTELDYVRLDGAILDGASLRGARWTGVSLREASLAGADLTGVRFVDARFEHTSLERCQGDRAVFRNCNFQSVSFDGASLQAPEFDRCELWSTTLEGAQLRNPCFDNIVTDGAWFASVDFADVERLTFGPASAPPARGWRIPEAIGHDVAGYWATLLDQVRLVATTPLLEAAAPPLIHAALSTVLSIQPHSSNSVIGLLACLLVFLSAHPDYRKHAPRKLQDQVVDQLHRTLRTAGERLLDWPGSAHQLASVAQIAMERLMDSDAPLQIAAALSPAIVQLVLLGRRPDVPPRAATVTEALEAVYRDCLPADMNRAIDEINARDDERMVPLVSPDLGRVLLISTDYFHQRVRLMPVSEGAHRTPWTNLYRLTRTPDANGSAAGYQEEVASVPDDLGICRFLADAYRKQMSAGLHFEMLELFPLGSRFNAIFLAISSNVSTERMVSDEHQTALHRIFDPMSVSGAQGLPMLVPEHESALLRLASPQDGSIPAAWLLLCLSVMWTRLSSREFLGETGKSPTAIRRYALALLDTAIARDPSMLPAQHLEDWQRRLCGTVHEEHTCTQVLADNMLTLLRATARHQPALQAAMRRVWPPAWRNQWIS